MPTSEQLKAVFEIATEFKKVPQLMDALLEVWGTASEMAECMLGRRLGVVDYDEALVAVRYNSAALNYYYMVFDALCRHVGLNPRIAILVSTELVSPMIKKAGYR